MIRGLSTASSLLLLAALLSALAACGDEPKPDPDPGLACPDSISPRPDHLNEVVCAKAFVSLANRPDTALFANVSLVKFVIDLQDDGQTYFFDSVKYRLHYNFCDENLQKEGLDDVGTHREFNERQYRSQDRRFILGTIAFYADQDLVTMEFASGDLIEADDILFAFGHLQERLYFGDRMVYRPISVNHEAAARTALEGQIPILYTAELFEGISYQPLNPARAFGYLRLLGDRGPATARPTDIVVLTDVPNDISPVSGVVTEAFQTPLSHVNILSRNRGTPNMALKDAMTDPRFTALEDQLVELEVTPQDFVIRPASLDDAEAYWDRIRPSETFVPPLDLSVGGLPDLEGLGHRAVGSIGAKAANTAEMFNIEGLSLPESPFAIPFYHYRDHLIRHGLDAEIEAMLSDPSFRDDPAWRAERLEALRQSIREAPLRIGTQAALYEKIQSTFGTRKVRFRSSTNSEDLPGFNGAGLYTSSSARIGSQDSRPEDAVRTVWASLWNDRAVAERDFYRIDHRQVAMAVLVHPSFPNEAANGVALTVNIFNPRRPAHFINVQEGNNSVANPAPGEVADQYLMYRWYDRPEAEFLSYSNLKTDGEPVLSWDEMLELSEALSEIHEHFWGIYRGFESSTWGMDVEFKFTSPHRELVIKQARPLPQR